MTGRYRTKLFASVVGPTTLRLAAISLAALAGSYVARAVAERQGASGGGLPVASDALDRTPICTACRSDRKKAGKEPRRLIRLPIEVTQDKTFNRKGLAILVCEHCDGDSLLENAIRTHEKRVG